MIKHIKTIRNNITKKGVTCTYKKILYIRISLKIINGRRRRIMMMA